MLGERAKGLPSFLWRKKSKVEAANGVASTDGDGQISCLRPAAVGRPEL
jgi:hypothetical protein